MFNTGVYNSEQYNGSGPIENTPTSTTFDMPTGNLVLDIANAEINAGTN